MDMKELHNTMEKRLNNSTYGMITADKPKMDLTDLQQKAYEELTLYVNAGETLGINAKVCIEQIDDLVDALKPYHFQLGDTIYYYNRCKNKIEKYVVESVAIKDSHIIYNYIYDSEAVKGSYDEILRYAMKCIQDDSTAKINALKGGD